MPAKEVLFQTTFSRYRTVRPLGEGGAGYVHEVEDEKGEHFALKVLKSQAVTDDRRKRFHNEILFCQRTSHQNVLKVIDHGLVVEKDQPLPFYVMALYESSFRSLMKAGLAQDAILQFFSQILDGTEAAHLQNVAHRDLKPENVLYDKATARLVVADFGIARFQQDELYTAVETRASDRLANFQYAAPEQRVRGKEVDHRADIYSLGLMLNEIFTGQIPQGTGYRTVESVLSKLSYIDDIVASMIRQEPTDRPQSIDSVKSELIARGAEFLSRQRLSTLKSTVIPSIEVDDPLVSDPVHIVAVDWDNGTLSLVLSQPVNERWQSALRNMGNYSSVSGKGPEMFSIHGDRATIQSREQEVQPIINYFKGWLPLISRKYEESLRDDQRRREERQTRELQARIQAEEARARILRNVKL